MKGIVLAGGSGTRLYPITKGISKQLLPLYDKPMIYYPISVLMEAGIRDILIISTPDDIDSFKRLLGDGSDYGIKFSYTIQEKPEGIAQAFIIGEEFIGKDDVCLILGDNIFHGPNFDKLLKEAVKTAKLHSTPPFYKKTSYATIFGYYVNDPERYGVAEFDEETGEYLVGIEEKPKNPKSNYAVVGLYFYPNDVIEKAKNIKPSARGELEITTLNQVYLDEGRLGICKLPFGFAWLDTGTFSSLAEASSYVETIERRQGIQIACLEQIAYKKGWIDDNKLDEIINHLGNNDYKEYLIKLKNKRGI
jgi:glucose-1-phosphate thymidylyltransferase